MSSRGTASSNGSAEPNASNVDEAFELIERGLDLLTAASTGPWWQLSGEQLPAAAVRLHAIESRVAFAQVGVVGEAIARGLPAETGAKDGAGWLRGLVPLTPGQAFARAGLAQALHQPGAHRCRAPCSEPPSTPWPRPTLQPTARPTAGPPANAPPTPWSPWPNSPSPPGSALAVHCPHAPAHPSAVT